MAPVKPGYLPITINVGSAFDAQWTWYDKDPADGGVPVDLTGYTARAQIRVRHNAPDPPLASMTTENGGITLGGAAGTVAFFIAADVTATYTALTAGVWDCELVPPAGAAHAFRWVEGPVYFSPEVTR